MLGEGVFAALSLKIKPLSLFIAPGSAVRQLVPFCDSGTYLYTPPILSVLTTACGKRGRHHY